MSKHTPGPWSFRRNYDGSLDFFAEDGTRVILCNARLVNQDANARMIAAAPELLESLQGLMHEWTTPTEYLDAAKAARAAITKATGGQA
jgi:hypothetical protein